MGKFGIGARVLDSDGDEGVIVGKKKGERLIGEYGNKYTDGFTMWFDKSELIALKPAALKPADACAETCEVAYKVGDRVIAIADFPRGFVGTVAAVDFDMLDVKFDEWSGGHSGYAKDGTEAHWWLEGCDIAPFRLEAGRYYKTRDGRKVGPMEDSGSLYAAEYPFTVCHQLDTGFTGKAWREDGTFCPEKMEHPADIVAELVEPAVEAAPEAPNEPATKFKAGDRIRRVRDDASWAPIGYEAVVQEGGRYTDKQGFSGCPIYEGQWELVPPSPPRKFKVGDRVNYIGGKSQNIWQGVTITRDSGISYFATCPKQGEGGFTDEMIELAAPEPKFKVGDRVDYNLTKEAWQGVVVTEVHQETDGSFMYSVACRDRGIGRVCETWIDLVTTATPAFPIGAKVMLTATVTGHNPVDKHNVNVVIDGLPACCASHGIPATALRVA